MQCSIGKALSNSCSHGLQRRSAFSARDLELFAARTGVSDISSVCDKHDKWYRTKYELQQKRCSDPFGLAGVSHQAGLQTVSAQLYDDCKTRPSLRKVIEGKKLCWKCRKAVVAEIARLDNPTAGDQDIVQDAGENEGDIPGSAGLPPAGAPAGAPPLHPAPLSLDPPLQGAPLAAAPAGPAGPAGSDSSPPGPTPRHDARTAAHSVAGSSSAGPSTQHADAALSVLPTVFKTPQGGGGTESEAGTSSGGSIFSPGCNVDPANKATEPLRLKGVSPLVESKARRSATYVAKKEQAAVAALRQTFQDIRKDTAASTAPSERAGGEIDHEAVGRELLQRLKDIYQTEQDYSRKIQILSLAPSSWSNNKLMEEFGATRYIVEKMRQCVAEQGVFCQPERKVTRPMSTSVLEKVVEFYKEPDISRELPGAKEFVSVKTETGRVHKQKRLVLANLREVYAEFKKRHPDCKIGFSKFAELRPKECVLAGASGTHVVCVCVYHKNFKLMYEAGSMAKIQGEDGEILFPEYRSLLFSALCKPMTEACQLGQCNSCPGTDHLRTILRSFYQKNFVEKITYSQWVKVDRSSLETVTKNVEDFVEAVLENVPTVTVHDYITKQQQEFYRQCRDNLKEGEVLVVADFSENYKFVLQNAAQGMHWNNDAATVFPFACYYKPAGSDELKNLNLVIISDYLTHSTTAVYAFQHVLIKYLTERIPGGPKKIYYFSDGAASQFKNRFNMINLLFHGEDFGIPAEWHFFSTSHGKGPSDGLGGVTKRLVARASLQLSENEQIRTPQQFFDYAKANITGIDYAFVSEEDIKTCEKKIRSRFRHAPEVRGIRNFHAAVPETSEILSMKTTSKSSDKISFRLKSAVDTPVEDEDDPDAVMTRSTTKRTQATATEHALEVQLTTGTQPPQERQEQPTLEEAVQPVPLQQAETETRRATRSSTRRAAPVAVQPPAPAPSSRRGRKK